MSRPDGQMLQPPLLAPWLAVVPPVPPGAWLRRAHPLPFPFDEPGRQLLARGRQCVWHGVRVLGLGEGDEVLVPAYHSGAEVTALVAAGIACRFYDGTELLEPDEAELAGLAGPRTRALYLTHFLGFPQDAARWRRWCGERGLLLLEDAAHAWLAEADGGPAGSFGDLAIVCPYKFLGLPDGAVLVAPPASVSTGEAGRGLGAALRSHVAWLKARPALPARAATLPLKARGLRAGAGGNELALGDPNRPASAASRFLLPRLASGRVVERRREHYRLLLAELGEWVPAPFRRLPDGAVPLVFPVESDAPGELRTTLRARGVLSSPLWREPHPAVPAAGFPRTRRLRARAFVLPVHQELTRRDVERIVRAVREAIATPPGPRGS